jgi:hypothetical protein
MVASLVTLILVVHHAGQTMLKDAESGPSGIGRPASDLRFLCRADRI